MHTQIRSSFSTHELAPFPREGALVEASCDPLVALASTAIELGLGVATLTMRRLRVAAVGDRGEQGLPSLPLTLRAW